VGDWFLHRFCSELAAPDPGHGRRGQDERQRRPAHRAQRRHVDRGRAPLQLVRSDVTGGDHVFVAVDGTREAALIRIGTLAVDGGVDREAAGKQSVRPGRAAVVGQPGDAGVGDAVTVGVGKLAAVPRAFDVAAQGDGRIGEDRTAADEQGVGEGRRRAELVRKSLAAKARGVVGNGAVADDHLGIEEGEDPSTREGGIPAHGAVDQLDARGIDSDTEGVDPAAEAVLAGCVAADRGIDGHQLADAEENAPAVILGAVAADGAVDHGQLAHTRVNAAARGEGVPARKPD